MVSSRVRGAMSNGLENRVQLERGRAIRAAADVMSSRSRDGQLGEAPDIGSRVRTARLGGSYTSEARSRPCSATPVDRPGRRAYRPRARFSQGMNRLRASQL